GEDELESGGIAHDAAGAGDEDLAGLEGLTQRVEDADSELGRLVEEEHPVVGEGDHARSGERAAAADERGHARGVVRCLEWRSSKERCPRGQGAGDRVDRGDLERLRVAERWQDGRQAFGEHRLARPWWAAEEGVV